MNGTDPRVPPNTSFALPTLSPMPTIPKGVGLAPDGSAVPAGVVMPPPDDVIPPTNRAKKKAAVDRALLEKVLKARQGGETPQP